MADRLVLRFDRLPTPVGELIVLVDREDRLRAVDWTDHEARLRRLLDRYHGAGRYDLEASRDPGGLATAMRAYFRGDLRVIDNVRVALAGTPFQQGIWQTLRQIPVGTTISYAGLAARVGRPRAIRAAGLANGQNPISIVVPCHRVIGTNGTLTGYGGGLPRKQWLLEHEGALGAPTMLLA